jgi:hypothetical protein
MRRLRDDSAAAGVQFIGCDLFEQTMHMPRGLRMTRPISPGAPIVALPLSALITSDLAKRTSTGRLVHEALSNLRLEATVEHQCMLSIFILENSGVLPAAQSNDSPFHRTYCNALPKMESPTETKFPVFWSDKVPLLHTLVVGLYSCNSHLVSKVMNELKGSSLRTDVLRKRSTIHTLYAAVARASPSFGSRFCRDAFQWVRTPRDVPPRILLATILLYRHGPSSAVELLRWK